MRAALMDRGFPFRGNCGGIGGRGMGVRLWIAGRRGSARGMAEAPPLRARGNRALPPPRLAPRMERGARQRRNRGGPAALRGCADGSAGGAVRDRGEHSPGGGGSGERAGVPCLARPARTPRPARVQLRPHRRGGFARPRARRAGCGSIAGRRRRAPATNGAQAQDAPLSRGAISRASRRRSPRSAPLHSPNTARAPTPRLSPSPTSGAPTGLVPDAPGSGILTPEAASIISICGVSICGL